MQVYLFPETIFTCPFVLQVAPALTAAEFEGTRKVLVKNTEARAKVSIRFISKR
jgi:hypothetical protein